MSRRVYAYLDKKCDQIMYLADTQLQLAKICGVKVNTIKTSISHQKKKGKPCRYIAIDIEEDEDD